MCDKYSNKLKKNQEKYKYFSLNYQLVTIQLQTSVWLNFSAFF